MKMQLSRLGAKARKMSICAGVCSLAVMAMPAQAQISEVRIGVAKHDVNVTGNGAGGKEGGVDIQGEVVFHSPDFLSWAFSPRPYFNLAVNTEGLTSHGGGGLLWATDFSEKFFGEISFGLAVHDGIVELPTDPGDPVRIELDATRVILGSDVLFRTTLGLGVHLNDQWDSSLYFEHLSHGQILAQGRNEGLDNIGIRFSRKFGN